LRFGRTEIKPARLAAALLIPSHPAGNCAELLRARDAAVKPSGRSNHHIKDAFAAEETFTHEGLTMVFWPRRPLRHASLTLGLAIVLSGAATERAAAQSTLQAHYRATLAGLPIGSGAWTIDLADDHYTMAASGEASGLFRIMAKGDGSAVVRGAILSGSRIVPMSYAMNVRARNKIDQVKMALSGGAVKELFVEPPVTPDPQTVPLTEAHKRGVLDPISAGIIPGAGADAVGPEACRRTLAVFDGRMRFDIALSFKRMEKVKTERGYEGPAVVCAVSYNPVGGHEKDKYAIRFLRENRDMELWYAPIAGTRFLAVYRISLPTLLGMAVLQATRFVATARATRAGASPARTQ
jgi:hypothetical protein